MTLISATRTNSPLSTIFAGFIHPFILHPVESMGDIDGRLLLVCLLQFHGTGTCLREDIVYALESKGQSRRRFILIPCCDIYIWLCDMVHLFHYLPKSLRVVASGVDQFQR
jgi:hypothetical protein